ncbi:hypothetical protein TspCOW1_04790 [Thiohalobacter sp. COW1]|uniref:class I SAM-dependent methyltransferase n=1 Tax=Thiohalobacter sp. COW1 TaxID=2795687 RepID=UPI0019162126|nr:class I SAM-dependent methyltransferase [Thiohalobacter sp. COW1]BCO30376.1 hypothetical protein TspCOW1_04790 [Thiohalobacter sp. COW1]
MVQKFALVGAIPEMSRNDMLSSHKSIWDTKPELRRIYESYYSEINDSLVGGSILELGAGFGASVFPERYVVKTDIQRSQWIDFVADAQALPVSDQSFDNIVMLDVLHHIEYPMLFINEAVRVLKPKGRIVMIEPAITPFSYCFYKYLHHEPVDMTVDPFLVELPDVTRWPYDSNQAIPTLMFVKNRSLFEQITPILRVATVEWLSLIAYPLSGGFSRWSLLPNRLTPIILKMERPVSRMIGHFSAFRMKVVIEKLASEDFDPGEL